MLGFIAVIFAGSILLSLPISTISGKSLPYIDALFTATTSTCVTGLVTVTTSETWSTFGQIVILILIQVGGLGVITVVSAFMIFLHHRIGLSDTLLIQDAFNLNTLSGLAKFVKKVIAGTLLIEALGAICYMFVFIPQFGLKGIWVSVFTSISAFCNAGIDIITPDSLCSYATNPVINITTSLLIIFGGIGYIVWWDVIYTLKKHGKCGIKALKHLTLHSKIALSSSLILIIGGALCFFIFEYNNPGTLQEHSFANKMQIAFFQSVTTRTAGFASVPQQNLTNASAVVSLLLMFVGGSPVGTAGGIKTVTFVILIITALSTVKNKNDVCIYNRSISGQAVSKALAVTLMSFVIVFVSTVLLAAVTQADAIDLFFETVSATATVGLSRNLTPTLNIWGKIIIIITMYLGRIGPISLAIAFKTRKKNQNIIKNPTEEISVG